MTKSKSFWDSYDPPEHLAGTFLSEEEAKELWDAGAVVRVTDVGAVESGKYGNRRVVTLDVGGVSRKKSLTSGVEGRDKLLADMAAYLAQNGAGRIPINLEMWGPAYGFAAPGFEDGSPDHLEPPAEDEVEVG